MGAHSPHQTGPFLPTDFCGEPFIEAGFEVSAPPEYTFAFTIDPPAPWFISLVAVRGTEPPYAEAIYSAWRAIGVENGFTDGIQFAKPGELKIYVGSK